VTAASDPRAMNDPREEVTNMLRRFSARRLLAVAIAGGVLAAVAPATALAANGGGGPRQPLHVISR
jgi:hypothetical protein